MHSCLTAVNVNIVKLLGKIFQFLHTILNSLIKIMTKVAKTTLNLKQFFLRQEVLKLYRDIFRTIRLVPDANSQQELRAWARQDFRANQNQNDEVAIKMLVQYGRRSLNELRQSLHLSGVCNDKK